MNPRKVLFWLHLLAGVSAGAVILVLSLTGVLLAFERQIVRAAEGGLRAPAAPGSSPRPLSTLIDAAAGEGQQPSSIVLRSDPAAPVELMFGRERRLFVDRYTGQHRGEGATRVRRFFSTVESAHRWLLFGEDSRARGKAITGASNLAFFLLVLSGPFLWFPARRSRSAFRSILVFRRGLRGRARDFNWHNVLGIWSFLPLAAIVFSGAVISYPWLSRLVMQTFGSTPPPQPRQEERARQTSLDVSASNRLWQAGLAQAATHVPAWQSISVRLPFPETGTATFMVDEGNGARPDLRSQLVLDTATARLVEHRAYTTQQPGQKARAWLRWIHTGEAGGLPGQLAAMLASAAGVVLVWTGVALSLRRLARRLRGGTTTTPQLAKKEMQS